MGRARAPGGGGPCWLGLLGLGAAAALGLEGRAQTVSTSLRADVPRYYGERHGLETRGLLTDVLGEGAPASVVGGSSVPRERLVEAPWQASAADGLRGDQRLAGLAVDEGLRMARARAAESGGVEWVKDLVEGLLGEARVEPTEFKEFVHAPASAGGGVGNPFFVEIGSHALLPNTADQWITLTVRNDSASPVSVGGLNFNFQVADSGPESEGGFGVIDGPNITDVDLVTGTLFAPNNTGTTTAGGNPPQAGLWTVTTQSGTVTLAAGGQATLARVQFSTVGFSSSASWTLSLRAGPPGGLQDGTSFSQPGTGGEVNAIEVQFNEGQIAVPEPWALSLASAAGLGGWIGVRRSRAVRRSVRTP